MKTQFPLRTNSRAIASKVQHPSLARWAVSACLVLAVACADIRQHEGGPSDLERYLYYAGDPISNFSSVSGIDGWLPLSRDRLVVWTRLDNAYLLTVVPTCQELEHATGIALISKVEGTVAIGFDSVRVGRDTCRIIEIRPVDYRLMKQEERELRESKKP